MIFLLFQTLSKAKLIRTTTMLYDYLSKKYKYHTMMALQYPIYLFTECYYIFIESVCPSVILFFAIIWPFFTTLTSSLSPSRFTLISKSESKALIWSRLANCQSCGNRGVSSNECMPVGRIPNRPSVYIRQYKPLSADR